MRAILLLCLFCITHFAFAQRFKASEELGLSMGGSYYYGDLNKTHFSQMDYAAGLFYRKNIDRRWSFRLGVNATQIGAADSLSNDPNMQNRNLHFRSRIYEFYGQVEFSYFPFELSGKSHFRFTPYLFIGFSQVMFNPEGQHEGTWYELQPLGTEGQTTTARLNEPYKLTTSAIPMGMGIKWRLTNTFVLGFEGGFRKTYTDYLDDVSGIYADPDVLNNEANYLTPIFADPSIEKGRSDGTNTGLNRGNPQDKDWIFISGIQLIIKLNKEKDRCPAWN